MALTTRLLTPDLWPDLEALFGPRGATAGCWCQWPVLAAGESFDSVKGPEARTRLERQVACGERRGVLAYDDGQPVGWAAYGPRRYFRRIDRAPSLKCDDADAVWSIPCFFVKAGHRGRGVAAALLQAAVKAARDEGATLLEGYPVATAGTQAPAFIWTGTVGLFQRAGFARVDDKAKGKVRMRRPA